MTREKKTVEAMIRLRCRSLHHTGSKLCPDCGDLFDYAMTRLDKCPFQEGKTTCANCRVHCYKPQMREQIRAVMRHSGPRMMFRHPFLALFHFIDGFRKEPLRGSRGN